MIDILKKEIEKKIGKKVTNRGDCELVSNVILETLEEEISYSTIRRLYGLVNETKPNNKTLDKLNLKELKRFYKNLDSKTLKIFDVRRSMNSKNSYGGTSEKNIKNMIKKYKMELR